MERRKISNTRMNEESSRSHAIFSIYVEIIKKIDQKTTTKKSILNLIDLAGSENQKKSGAEGLVLKEGNEINKSLLNLKKVISTLSKMTQSSEVFIPYRDSKLTLALRDSLGGNSKVIK